MRIPRRVLTGLLGWVAIAAPVFAEVPDAGRAVELRFRRGDDARWAARDWDDRDWAPIRPDAFPAREGIYWVRFRVWPGCTAPAGLAGPPDYRPYTWPLDREVDSVFLAVVFSFELYWDGQLLERSGVVGNSRAMEVPGPVDHLVRIPDALRGPGEHVVALRMSSWRYNFSATKFDVAFGLVNLQRRLIEETRQPIFPSWGWRGHC